jgi:cell wall assembly regulator SMI1
MNISAMARCIDSVANKDYGRGASDREISDAEHVLGVRFPEDYKFFLSRFGWAEIGCDILYGLGTDAPYGHSVVKNAVSERHEAQPHIPHHLVPIMNDGAGNNYCLDTLRFHGGECPVVFWDHEHPNGSNQVPIDVAQSFGQWIVDRIGNSPDSRQN